LFRYPQLVLTGKEKLSLLLSKWLLTVVAVVVVDEVVPVEVAVSAMTI
jgi:hypothetical protein